MHLRQKTWDVTVPHVFSLRFEWPEQSALYSVDGQANVGYELKVTVNVSACEYAKYLQLTLENVLARVFGDKKNQLNC